MAVAAASIQNLALGNKAKWFHHQTTAIRVPMVYSDRLLTIAREWDDADRLAAKSIVSIAEKTEIETETETEIETEIEDLLRRALEYLLGCCDGARSSDGAGFNRFDVELARRLASVGEWSSAQAKAIWTLLQKYRKTQLAAAGIDLPAEWEAIAANYEGDPTTIEGTHRIYRKGARLAIAFPWGDGDWDAPQFGRTIKDLGGGYKWDAAAKEWTIPLEYGSRLLEAASGQFEIGAGALKAIEENDAKAIESEAIELARREAEAIALAEELLADIRAANLDNPLPNGQVLYPHQVGAVTWLLGQTYRGYRGGILADQMGLGKTKSALVAAKALRDRHGYPVFVVCPASLKENWLREADGVGVPIEVYSWAKLPQPLEFVKYLIIFDECHYAQSGSRSNRGKQFLALAQHDNCVAAYCLTGTPLKNGQPLNLLPLLEAVKWEGLVGKGSWEYKLRYCNARKLKHGWDFTGSAHLDELAKKTETVILRRTKADCLKDLPAKQRTTRYAEISASDDREYRQRIEAEIQGYRERVASGTAASEAEALVTLGLLRKIGSEYKIETTVELASDLLEEGQQVVVFAEYLEAAKQLHQKLGGELLTGETPTEERQAIVDRFQGGESKVLVGTIKAGGVGLTLTAASHVILHDRPWTPGDAEQAEDRCHRIGQLSSVTAHWISLGQIDRAIDSLLIEKSERIELVLAGKRKILRGVGSIADLAKELLE